MMRSSISFIDTQRIWPRSLAGWKSMMILMPFLECSRPGKAKRNIVVLWVVLVMSLYKQPYFCFRILIWLFAAWPIHFFISLGWLQTWCSTSVQYGQPEMFSHPKTPWKCWPFGRTSDRSTPNRDWISAFWRARGWNRKRVSDWRRVSNWTTVSFKYAHLYKQYHTSKRELWLYIGTAVMQLYKDL